MTRKTMMTWLIAVCCGINAAAGNFVLVKDGTPQAVVIQNNAAAEAQTFLVRETAKCGAKLTIADKAESGNRIVFEVKDAPLEEQDAFIIDFPDPRTMKITCTRTSARWAANLLLETAFGIRRFFPHLAQSEPCAGRRVGTLF